VAAATNPPSDQELKQMFARLGFFTSCGIMMPILRQAYKAALVSDVTMLLEGETGTGKQILAYAIHQLDQKRRPFPFITAHCSTISEALAESEFLGHRRGAFTGAVADRPGLFQSAHQGSLVLDDVSDLPLLIQPKLLDVIQRGVLRPVGSDREVPVNVRIIATSNQPLKSLVLLNRFRSDLYYRLNVIRLRLPPLRERWDDLADLVLTFAERHSGLYYPIVSVEPELISFLQTQLFSGNLRELENAVLRMLFAKDRGTSLSLADWVKQASEEVTEGGPDLIGQAAQNLWEAISEQGLPYAQVIRQTEKRIIETAIKAGGETRRQVAKRLRTSERTLYHKIRTHHLSDRGT
jgi:two-component system, NtrC family, response regulator PilR